VSEPVYHDVLREYLDLYKRQEPRQAELVVPAWAFRKLNALTEVERRRIISEINDIALLHGLQTPTKIIVAAPPQ
jgi:hypothetical protein